MPPSRRQKSVFAQRWPLQQTLRNRFRFRPGFFIQRLHEFLQARYDLRRFREFLGVVRPALRHLGERHHHGEGVINRVFDLAEFLLQFDEFFVGDCARWVAHD